MNKNDYKAIADYCTKHSIKFAVIPSEMELDPATELNGFGLIDTETFEIPCCFEVERGLIVCLDTPKDMTPGDTGESYDKYYNQLTDLRLVSRPQYIAVDGSYIKLMCWCDWAGETSSKDEFITACNEAIEKALKDAYSVKIEEGEISPLPKSMLDFRVHIGDVNLMEFGCTDKELDEMYDLIKDITDFDCELYINYYDHAETADHGIRNENVKGMTYLTAY